MIDAERREKASLSSERWRRAHGIRPRRPAQRPWLGGRRLSLERKRARDGCFGRSSAASSAVFIAIVGGWAALRLTGSLNWMFAALASPCARRSPQECDNRKRHRSRAALQHLPA